jgi:alginate O-acetyltransferase complex protein AlgI
MIKSISYIRLFYMIFNSKDFLLFIIVFFLMFGIVPNKKKNLFILGASYFFYGYWKWQFLSLILLSTLIDYVCGLYIYKYINLPKKKIFLCISIFSNLGILVFFKYFNFFLNNINTTFELFGISTSLTHLNIILPMGISFYTFQSLSYSIDVYRGSVRPTKNFTVFALYVSYFPQLVAGPIERASKLLPQLLKERQYSIENLNSGLSLIILGLFKKCVIADNLALIANTIFNSPETFSGSITWIGMYAFAFQIYGDFSGYTDIARGISRMLGIDLMLNFKNPYFAQNPSDFWRRWHISLSQWLRDYLYIGLGGNKGSKLKTYRNLMLTMTLGGLWHGASWNFIFWGVYHGGLLILHRKLEKFITQFYKKLKVKEKHQVIINRVIFFHLICFSWVLFRANSIIDVFIIMSNLFHFYIGYFSYTIDFFFYVTLIVAVDYLEFKNNSNNLLESVRASLKIPISVAFILIIVFIGAFNNNEFIYFQF